MQRKEAATPAREPAKKAAGPFTVLLELLYDFQGFLLSEGC